jgi:hypothetical protein
MVAKSERWMLSLILGCFVVILCGGLVQAQTTTGQEEWVYIYDNPDIDHDDLFRDIKRSPYDGFLYATGRHRRTSSYDRVALHKIDPATGVAVWVVAWDPAGTDYYGDGYELDFDATGNIYIAAAVRQPTSGRDFCVVKFDTHGVYQASHFYNGYGSRHDYARSIDIGPDGMVYVGGQTDDADNFDDFIVRKYDQNLNYLHMYRVDVNSAHCRCYRVRVDSDLNVWAAGGAKIGGSTVDFYVVRLDTALALQNYYKTSSPNPADYAFDLCLPWSGTGVYAGGRVYNSGNNYDMCVVRLDATCNEVWKWTYDNADNDQVNRIVCAPSNRVFAAGYTRDNTRANNSYTIACLSFGLDWIWTYDGSANGEDQVRDIDIDATGTYVYATGYSTETGNDLDLIVSKHSFADTTIWVYKYNGPAGEQDVGRAIDVSNNGKFYVAGNIELDTSCYEMGALSFSQNFPPTIPELESPVDNGYENSLTVTFRWLASEDFETSVASYYFGYSMDPTFATYDSLLVAGSQTYAAMTLSADTTWYWAVKAKDSNGNVSKFSDVWSFQFDFTDPPAPNPTVPADGGIELDSSITFTWDPVTSNREVPSPVTYVLQVDTASGFASPMAIDTTASTTITLELPLSEYYYYWHVMAYDAAGNTGPYCANRTFMIDLTPPVIDSETVWEETSFCGPFDCFAKVTDMWGIDEVLLYYKRMEDPAWFSTPMSEGSSDWYLAQIPAGTIDNDTIRYYYYAKDNAEHEIRVPVTDYYWFIGNSTGVVEDNPEVPNIFSFDVGSNLIKGKATFNLSLPRSSSVTLEIYDASGRRIATPVTGIRSAGNHTITWTPQTNGVYFYSLKSEWTNKTGKILFIR